MVKNLLVVSILFTISCSQQDREQDSSESSSSENPNKSYFDSCACFSGAVELAIQYYDPIDLANASKEINDSCRAILSMENALNSLQACDEVLLQLEALDSVKMSEFVQNSRFLLSNITDMP